MSSRNTKQKEIILDVLKNNRCHPTIAEICSLVQQIDDSIGQATVYRNIKKFVEDGTINVIKNRNGVDRYDYYKEHAHFECLNCGKILDILDSNMLDLIKDNIKLDEEIIRYNLMLEGYCIECTNKR